MADVEIREIFVTGLKNAHAMENQALSIMKPQVKRIENYPDIAAKLEQHIRETEGQIARLEEILSSLAEDHSSLKDMALSAVGAMAALGHSVAGDEILKNSFANFAFENFEIAAYNSLITVAELGGFAGLVPALQANLDEETAMARWLETNLRQTTIKFANLKEAGQTAKI
jgi:ferritin-like metal-binding protein YciE